MVGIELRAIEKTLQIRSIDLHGIVRALLFRPCAGICSYSLPRLLFCRLLQSEKKRRKKKRNGAINTNAFSLFLYVPLSHLSV